MRGILGGMWVLGLWAAACALVLGMVLLASATDARAQAGVDVAYSFQWIDVNGVDVDLESLEGGFLYDVQIGEQGDPEFLETGDWGLTFAGAGLAAVGSADASAWILGVEVGPWYHLAGIDVVAALRYEHFTPSMLGERTQTLGAKAGIIFYPFSEGSNVAIEAAYRHSEAFSGVDDVSSTGFQVGPRIALDL